jgi:nucleotide-binding universal stress UspA family protein
MAGTIVLGFDGSECSGSALNTAIDLARRYDDRLVVVFAVEPPMRSVGEEFREHEKALTEVGQRVATSALERAEEAGVEADIELVHERPAPAILDVARQRDAHMIVIGTHSESPLRGAILGSVPHKLLHVSDRPVVVVPIDMEVRRGR